MNNDTKKILHDLEHQRLEAIGIEYLARESSIAISILMKASEITDLDKTQIAASLAILARWIRESMCPTCVDLSVRIENELERSFREFRAEKEKEHET